MKFEDFLYDKKMLKAPYNLLSQSSREYYPGQEDLKDKIGQEDFDNKYLVRYNSNGEDYRSFAGIPKSAEDADKTVIAILRKGEDEYYFDTAKAKEIIGRQSESQKHKTWNYWKPKKDMQFISYPDVTKLNDEIVNRIKNNSSGT